MLKKLGLNAEVQSGDWGTLITRRAVREPPEKGGWNIFHTWLVGPDMVNPAVNFPIRGTGDKAWFGWPTDAKLEELREAWFNATDLGELEESRERGAAARVRVRAVHSDRPVHPADGVSREHLRRHHRAHRAPLERREEMTMRTA